MVEEPHKPNPQQETVNQPDSAQTSLQAQQQTVDLTSLTPLIQLAEGYFADAKLEREYRIRELASRSQLNEKNLEREAQQDVRNHEYSLEELKFKKYIFNRSSLIGALIIVLIFTVATVLILKGDADSGIKVLAYVAVGASLVAGGVGFERGRQERKKREELEAINNDDDDEDEEQ
jgi:predicted phage tail protein